MLHFQSLLKAIKDQCEYYKFHRNSVILAHRFIEYMVSLRKTSVNILKTSVKVGALGI